jgi:hypothetical protein
MDRTKFRCGYNLAERMWKEGGVTEERISATLLELLEANDPSELFGFHARIASLTKTANTAKKNAKH